MKTTFFYVLLSLFVSFSALAGESECLSKLTQNHQDDSRSFELLLDEYEIRDYGNDYLAQAIAVIRLVINDLGCARKDINFGKGPFGRSRSRCSQVVRSVDTSRVCYVESNLGYWFVSYDLVDQATVTFNRWD